VLFLLSQYLPRAFFNWMLTVIFGRMLNQERVLLNLHAGLLMELCIRASG
jgi:hypothetical protein